MLAGDAVEEAVGLGRRVVVLAAQLRQLGQQLPLALGEPRRRLHHDRHVQVAAPRSAQAPHAQAAQADAVAGLGSGAHRDGPLAVEGLDLEGGAQRRGGHGHAQLGEQVVAVALQGGVLDLLDHHVQVAVGPARDPGLAAAGQADAGALGHARGHLHLDVPAHVLAALAVAVLAGGDDHGAESAAGRARRAGHDIAEEGALDPLDGALAVALGAGDRLGAGRAAGALAGRARDVGVHGDGLAGAEGDVGQGHVDRGHGVLAAPGARDRPARGGAAEERLEDAAQVGEVPAEPAEAPGAAGDGLGAAQVVHLALLGVGQDLVGGRDLLELLLVAGAGDVGVQPARLPAVGLLDLLGAGLAADAEHLVVVAHWWGSSLRNWLGCLMGRCAAGAGQAGASPGPARNRER